MKIIINFTDGSSESIDHRESEPNLASRLEKKYSLKGFTKFIKKHEGEIV